MSELLPKRPGTSFSKSSSAKSPSPTSSKTDLESASASFTQAASVASSDSTCREASLLLASVSCLCLFSGKTHGGRHFATTSSLRETGHAQGREKHLRAHESSEDFSFASVHRTEMLDATSGLRMALGNLGASSGTKHHLDKQTHGDEHGSPGRVSQYFPAQTPRLGSEH